MWDRESWEQRAATTERIVGESRGTSADPMRPCGAVTVTVRSYMFAILPLGTDKQEVLPDISASHIMAGGHKEDQCPLLSTYIEAAMFGPIPTHAIF